MSTNKLQSQKNNNDFSVNYKGKIGAFFGLYVVFSAVFLYGFWAGLLIPSVIALCGILGISVYGLIHINQAYGLLSKRMSELKNEQDSFVLKIAHEINRLDPDDFSVRIKTEDGVFSIPGSRINDFLEEIDESRKNLQAIIQSHIKQGLMFGLGFSAQKEAVNSYIRNTENLFQITKSSKAVTASIQEIAEKISSTAGNINENVQASKLLAGSHKTRIENDNTLHLIKQHNIRLASAAQTLDAQITSLKILATNTAIKSSADPTISMISSELDKTAGSISSIHQQLVELSGLYQSDSTLTQKFTNEIETHYSDLLSVLSGLGEQISTSCVLAGQLVSESDSMHSCVEMLKNQDEQIGHMVSVISPIAQDIKATYEPVNDNINNMNKSYSELSSAAKIEN